MKVETTASKAIDRIFQFWPLWILLASGIMGYFRLQYTVEQIEDTQKKWQTNLEQRREKTREELESIRTRLTRIETMLSNGN